MPIGVIIGSIVWVTVVFLLMMFRNWQVYKFRIDLLRNDFDTYAKLPSMHHMVLKFWKPLSSFVKEERGQNSDQTNT
jgi:hypothetical protein